MAERNFMQRLEDVLDHLSLRTFDAPLTLDYRFGKFEAEEGWFHTFVREDDIERMLGYMEITGDQIYFVALEYPGYEAIWQNIQDLALKCRKTLGRHHAATFIVAVEEGIGEEREKLVNDFKDFRKSRIPGIYYDLKIWDAAGLAEAEHAMLTAKKNEI